MNKESLEKRIAELTAAYEQGMANLNAIVGRRAEAQEMLGKLENTEESEKKIVRSKRQFYQTK